MTQMVKVAKLDAERIFWGIEEKPLDEVKAGDVVFGAETLKRKDIDGVTFVEGDCDNPGGKYRWNEELQRFDPLSRMDIRQTPTSPLAERALYELVLEHVKAGAPAVPRYTLDWALWYEQTLDKDLGWSGLPLAKLIERQATP